MIELNLLPDVKLQFVRAEKARRQVITAVSIGTLAAVGLVVLFAIYVYMIQPIRGVMTDNGIKDANSKLAADKSLNDYLTIQQQLHDLPGLHQAKPMYSRLIDYLPTLNPSAPNSISITQLSIDSSVDPNAVTLQAYAPTYTAATVFESTLQSALFTYTLNGQTSTTPLFTSVTVTNTALGQDSSGNKVVTFTVTLEVDPNVFAFASTNTSVSVPNKDATSSAQNVPVFANGGGQ